MIYFTGDIHGAADGIADFVNKTHPTTEDVIVLLGGCRGKLLYRPPRQHAEGIPQRCRNGVPLYPWKS